MSDLSSRLVALTTPANYNQAHYITSTSAFNNPTFHTAPVNYPQQVQVPHTQRTIPQIPQNYQNYQPTFQQHPHYSQFVQQQPIPQQFSQQVRQQPADVKNNYYTYSYNPNVASSTQIRPSGQIVQHLSTIQEYEDSDSSDDDAELILKPLDLIRLEMPGDGACLFRAASQFIYGTGKFHMLVRRNVVREMIKRKEQFAPFIHDENNLERISMREYCATMLLPTTWGGDLELRALSYYYQRKIIIYSNQREEPMVIGEEYNNELKLWYSHGTHYDCVYTKRQMEVMSACQSIVLDLVSLFFETDYSKPEQYHTSAIIPYHNFEMVHWIKDLIDLEAKDRKMARELQANVSKEEYMKRQAEIQDYHAALRLRMEEKRQRQAIQFEVQDEFIAFEIPQRSPRGTELTPSKSSKQDSVPVSKMVKRKLSKFLPKKSDKDKDKEKKREKMEDGKKRGRGEYFYSTYVP